MPHEQHRDTTASRCGHCAPAARDETNRHELKLVPFVCRTDACARYEILVAKSAVIGGVIDHHSAFAVRLPLSPGGENGQPLLYSDTLHTWGFMIGPLRRSS